MKYTGVYVWNLIGTNKYYVGQSIDVCARTMQHLASIEDPDNNTKWARALKEHGPLAFEIVRGVPCVNDKNKLDALEVKLIQEYNAYYDGFNSTRGNHWDKDVVKAAVKKTGDQRMLPVVSFLAKEVFKRIQHTHNRKILIIGSIDPFITKTLVMQGCDVTLVENTTITEDYWIDSGKHIVLRVDDEELIRRLNELYMNNYFDLIIANPPYKKGGSIIDEALKHCNEAVVLMPGSNYGTRDLFKHVKSITCVDSNSFEGVVICDLTLATLDHGLYHENYDEFVLYRYNPDITSFVICNSRLKHPYLFKSAGGDKVYLAHLDINIDFLLSGRVLDDGVHNDERAVDFQFNMNNTIIKPTYQCVVVRFPDAAYKRNFAKFWYNNPLMHNILKGAHSSGFRTEVWNLIPKLDYSKDRDYANLTLDDIVKILEEENR